MDPSKPFGLVCVSFAHFILLLCITFRSCDQLCSLFALGGRAALGWLHFRNVAPKLLPSCFLPTTFIHLCNHSTPSLLPFIFFFFHTLSGLCSSYDSLWTSTFYGLFSHSFCPLNLYFVTHPVDFFNPPFKLEN